MTPLAMDPFETVGCNENGAKRPCPDEDLPSLASEPRSDGGETISSPAELLSSPPPRDHPAASGPRVDSPGLGSAALASDHTASPHVTGDTPSKRRKLTASEKEERRVAKEVAERQRAEQRAQRDELKQAKEHQRQQKIEERQRRDEEREEERRRKDQAREDKRLRKEKEQQQRDDEKRAKEAAQSKKERSQLRLNAFFVRSKTAKDQAAAAVAEQDPSTVPRTGDSQPCASLTAPPGSSLEATATVEDGQAVSDYVRTFPPFFVQSYVTLAPTCIGRVARNDLHAIEVQLDACIDPVTSAAGTPTPAPAACALTETFSDNRPARTPLPDIDVKTLVELILGSAEHPIDLTMGRRFKKWQQPPSEILHFMPVKYLKFAEDVRPPYRGTFTKRPSAQVKLARNPFRRALPSTNYDYDSEAEWEAPDPDDGEELDSEGEEDISDDEGDDLDGFLDDADAPEGAKANGSRRRAADNNLEPVSSGICWVDEHGATAGVSSTVQAELECYRLEVISATHQVPINPFSDHYWRSEGQKVQRSSQESSSSTTAPRMPLQAVKGSSVASNSQVMAPPPTQKPRGRPKTKADKHPPRLIEPELMNDFRAAVQGSDLTKTGLVEVLKKQFPRSSKDAIKDTLSIIAARIGQREADKRWVLIDGGASVA